MIIYTIWLSPFSERLTSWAYKIPSLIQLLVIYVYCAFSNVVFKKEKNCLVSNFFEDKFWHSGSDCGQWGRTKKKRLGKSSKKQNSAKMHSAVTSHSKTFKQLLMCSKGFISTSTEMQQEFQKDNLKLSTGQWISILDSKEMLHMKWRKKKLEMLHMNSWNSPGCQKFDISPWYYWGKYLRGLPTQPSCFLN